MHADTVPKCVKLGTPYPMTKGKVPALQAFDPKTPNVCSGVFFEPGGLDDEYLREEETKEKNKLKTN